MSSAASPDLTALRHRLHRCAELSGHEERTAAIVAEELAACRPDDLATGLGGHGVVAAFAGAEPGPTVLLRCDIDALPLPDGGDLPHASSTPGVAHKCGHDGHMTMLLGLARHLATERPPRGRAVLLFQPAEETGAGAAAVLADPGFAPYRPDRVLAVHNLPGHRLGAVVVRDRTFAAASRGLQVTLHGASSHAAEPQEGRSPVLAAAALAQAFAALPQSEAGLGEGALATVVGIEVGGPAYGTSPGDGRVMVTLRAWSDTLVERLARRCGELAAGIAAAHGLDHELAWREEFPATVNDAEVVAAVTAAARDAGLQVVRARRPFAWSEDFGHFTAAWPGALVGLGAGRDHLPLHHQDYDFPDGLLPIGEAFWKAALLRQLGPARGEGA